MRVTLNSTSFRSLPSTRGLSPAKPPDAHWPTHLEDASKKHLAPFELRSWRCAASYAVQSQATSAISHTMWGLFGIRGNLIGGGVLYSESLIIATPQILQDFTFLLLGGLSVYGPGVCHHAQLLGPVAPGKELPEAAELQQELRRPGRAQLDEEPRRNAGELEAGWGAALWMQITPVFRIQRSGC